MATKEMTDPKTGVTLTVNNVPILKTKGPTPKAI